MAWEDVLAGLGGGLQGFSRTYSWLAEMQAAEEEDRRRRLERETEKRQARIDALKKEEAAGSRQNAIDILSSQPRRTPLSDDLAAEVRFGGMGHLLEDASAPPLSWDDLTGTTQSSPGRTDTYRRATSAELVGDERAERDRQTKQAEETAIEEVLAQLPPEIATHMRSLRRLQGGKFDAGDLSLETFKTPEERAAEAKKKADEEWAAWKRKQDYNEQQIRSRPDKAPVEKESDLRAEYALEVARLKIEKADNPSAQIRIPSYQEWKQRRAEGPVEEVSVPAPTAGETPEKPEDAMPLVNPRTSNIALPVTPKAAPTGPVPNRLAPGAQPAPGASVPGSPASVAAAQAAGAAAVKTPTAATPTLEAQAAALFAQYQKELDPAKKAAMGQQLRALRAQAGR